jgi:hypothetical protein
MDISKDYVGRAVFQAKDSAQIHTPLESSTSCLPEAPAVIRRSCETDGNTSDVYGLQLEVE